MIQAYLYDAEGHDQVVELSQQVVEELNDRQLLWIDVQRDLATLKRVASIIGVSVSALNLLSRPKASRLENFESHFQFGCPVAPSAASDCDRIDFVVSEKWLLTVRDGPLAYISEFRDKDREETLTGRLTPAALTAALVDCHFEVYQRDVSTVKKMVDEVDGNVLAARKMRPPLAELVHRRTNVSSLRERIDEHREVIHGLLRPDFLHIAGKPHAAFFRALERRFERLEDAIDRAREMIAGSFDLYATRTAQDTNKQVQTLTLVTVIIGVAGAIAGIFGMNFDTPIAKTGLMGFVITVSGMILVALLILLMARKREWL